MGYRQDGPYLSALAGADLSTAAGQAYGAGQYHGVVFDSSDLIQLQATLGARIVGVLQDDPAAGRGGTVQFRDVSKVMAGAAFAVGDFLMVDTTSRFVVATTGKQIVAVALQPATAAGQIVAALIGPYGIV